MNCDMTNEEKAIEISKNPAKYETEFKKETEIRLQRYNAAMEMAEWKEHQMIDKACDWFEKNWTMYTYPSHLMFEDFRQAMKGE